MAICRLRGQGSLKYEPKDPFYFRKRKLTAAAFIRQNSIIAVLSGLFAVIACNASAQTPYDAGARIALADEINQTYGMSVTSSLSVTELFDIKNRLDVAVSIARKYGVNLDYREHSFIELCDIKERIRLSVAINRDYGRNIDWRAYGYNQLLDLDSQLKAQSESQSQSQKPTAQTPSQPTPNTS